jgi:hypothetical protein
MGFGRLIRGRGQIGCRWSLWYDLHVAGFRINLDIEQHPALAMGFGRFIGGRNQIIMCVCRFRPDLYIDEFGSDLDIE